MQGIDFQTIKNNLEEMYEYYEAIPRYEVLEHEITVLHSQIQEYIEIIILGIKNHVLIIEKDFWRLKFSNVYQEAKKDGLELRGTLM